MQPPGMPPGVYPPPVAGAGIPPFPINFYPGFNQPAYIPPPPPLANGE